MAEVGKPLTQKELDFINEAQQVLIDAGLLNQSAPDGKFWGGSLAALHALKKSKTPPAVPDEIVSGISELASAAWDLDKKAQELA